MSELVAELFGRFSFALEDLAAVNHHVVVAGDVTDLDGTEGKLVEAHRRTPARSRALFGRDDGKGRPARLHFFTAAVWAYGIDFFLFTGRQSL